MLFFKKFFDKNINNITQAKETNIQKKIVYGEWLEPLAAKELLQNNYIKKLIQIIYQQVSMGEDNFNNIYMKAFENFAEYVQLLPASEYHHHSEKAGLLIHTLEVVGFASKIRQQYMLPLDASPEEQIKVSEIWTAAVIFSALLHDIGKITADINIELKNGHYWYPWNGKLKDVYRFKYREIDKDYDLHKSLGLMFLHEIVPPIALKWIYSERKAYNYMIYTISGHYEKANIIGQIIQKADQTSVSHNLGGNIKNISEKPKLSLPNQIISAIRQITTRELKYNNETGGSDGWITEDALWVMSKTFADKIRANLHQEGITSVPDSNVKLFDEMQSYGILEKNMENKAIWKCIIRSDTGWESPSFTLLKIPHHIAWPSAEKKPDNFKGQVIIKATEKEQKNLNNNVINNTEQTQITESNEKQNIINDTNTASNEECNISNMVEDKTEKNDYSFALNLFSDEGKLDDNIEIKNNSDETIESSSISNIDETDINFNNIELSQKESNKDEQSIDILNWIKDGIRTKKIEINQTKALIHLVEGKVFILTPGIFQKYVREKYGKSDKEEWINVQKKFQQLNIHIKQITKKDSYNFWECSVTGPRKNSILKGYLINDPTLFFDEDKIPLNNYHLTLLNKD